MNVSTIIHVTDKETPVAGVMALDDGRRWISLRFGYDFSILLPDFEPACTAFARAIAATLLAAADEIDAMPQAEPIKPEVPVVATEEF